jgi:hypothetical protein
MRFLLCLVLLAGCHNPNGGNDKYHKLCKMDKYPNLEKYTIRYNVDMKQCPKNIPWQQFLYDYSESHGPIFNPNERKEYLKWKKLQTTN